MTDEQRAQLPAKQEGGRAALAVMEGQLGRADWFGGEGMTVADIALYAYTHVAEEGGFDLSAYPAVRTWLDRVAAEPGHVPMAVGGYLEVDTDRNPPAPPGGKGLSDDERQGAGGDRRRGCSAPDQAVQLPGALLQPHGTQGEKGARRLPSA